MECHDGSLALTHSGKVSCYFSRNQARYAVGRLGYRRIHGARPQEVSHGEKTVDLCFHGNDLGLGDQNSGSLRWGLAGGARPHRGGWSQEGTHLSRGLEEKQAAQGQAVSGLEPLSHLPSGSRPHPRAAPLVPQRTRCCSGLFRSWKGGCDGPGPGPLSLVICRSHANSYQPDSAHETHCYISRAFTSCY